MRVLASVAVLLLAACDSAVEVVAVPGEAGMFKSAASVRARRRAFDGAPPVIAHQNMGTGCINCHNARGLEVPGLGYAPPMPHELTTGLSAISRCTQCHVFKHTEELFKQSTFQGLRQDLRRGERLNPFAPPVMPHPAQMRENCLACHSGPAAREEIRTPHPERIRCTQCHLPQNAAYVYSR